MYFRVLFRVAEEMTKDFLYLNEPYIELDAEYTKKLNKIAKDLKTSHGETCEVYTVKQTYSR